MFCTCVGHGVVVPDHLLYSEANDLCNIIIVQVAPTSILRKIKPGDDLRMLCFKYIIRPSIRFEQADSEWMSAFAATAELSPQGHSRC